MRITIEKTNSTKLIDFTSEYGKAKAIWQDKNPECKAYNVEIDIDKCLKWDVDIKITSQTASSISVDKNNKIILIGLFESIDDDGYTVLRMGNSIIMFFTEGNIPEIGKMIEVTVDSIQMTPYE